MRNKSVMNRWVKNLEYQKAFSLIELMITLSILSFLGLSFTYVMKKNQTTMKSSDTEGSLTSELALARKMLELDLQQVALVNPSCAGNSMGGATNACGELKIGGGYTPLPGLDITAVSALTNLNVPSNVGVDPATLPSTSDALRIVVFNLNGSFNCRLNEYRSPNPSTSSATGAGAETLWPLRQGCDGNLVNGGLYALMQDSGARVFSNLFQITAMTDLGGGATSVDQLEVHALSGGNLFNQIGGLGRAGFNGGARIYPVRMIEWAFESGQGLFRREIIPSSTNINGFGTWRLVSSAVEGIQFFPITLSATGPVQHQRTMQFSADDSNNGVEDIRGVNVRMVVKSTKPTNDGVTYDNPLTAATENDHFPRQEGLFYVDFRNTKPGS